MESIKLILDTAGWLADKYGLNSAILVLILLGGRWIKRIVTNHLSHISQNISAVDKKVTCMDKKLGKLKLTVTKIDKKLAVREGICDERHKAK